MTSRGTASPSRTAKGTTKTTRLTGIDAARGLALLGMMATHLLPTFEADAQLTPTWIGLTFSGRAAALFAVLAGIGLALSTGKQRPPEGQELSGARRGIALRALVIAVVGLFLGGLEVNVAVILVHYAVLFLCVLPFIGLSIRPLCAFAAGWVMGSPVLGLPAAAVAPGRFPAAAAAPQPQLGRPCHARAPARGHLPDRLLPRPAVAQLPADRAGDRPAGADEDGRAGPAAGRRHRGGCAGQMAGRADDERRGAARTHCRRSWRTPATRWTACCR